MHKFYCPHCKEEVSFKMGQVKIPHFAHRHYSDCSYFSEGESDTHISGKIQLYGFFRRTINNAQLEGYIANIQQRPDILFDFNEKQFAIEFQCSTIPIHRVNERNDGYLSMSITPIWILLSSSWKSGMDILKLSTFQQSFISSNTLITYSPKNRTFYYLSNLIHIKSNTFIGKVDELPIHSQTWPFAAVKSLSFPEFKGFLNLYAKKRITHLHHLYYYNTKGIQSSFLRICYQYGVSPTALPSFIGIPTLNARSFTLHACEWQLAWLDFLDRKGLALEEVSLSLCDIFLKEFGNTENRTKYKMEAIKSYSELLINILISREGNFLNWQANNQRMEELVYKHFLVNRTEY